ncbi:DUF4012 domain-containing protein [Arthrobacter sp. Leaf141]|uniref:DUF4012 domain-containing protein n=1 Tax=Arthrobacter sp. Leaf141 TaxID=1736273 RepID=UPI001F245A62|nr:DUF4012 domain-containing protein [Arthrobacter sp. Leaf141]
MQKTSRSRVRQSTNMKRSHVKTVLICFATAALAVGLAGLWLGLKASVISDELHSAQALIAPLKDEIARDDSPAANATVLRLRTHTSAASDAAGDPLWTLASSLPWVGGNFGAVAEVARSADDVATLGLSPLVKVFASLDWQKLMPSDLPTDLKPLQDASPSVSAAAHVVRVSAERLERIDGSGLLPQISEPLIQARDQLRDVTKALDAAANAAEIAPEMLGANAPRNYLLMIQNNAESRASGGIPGALAVLTFDRGSLTLSGQSSAAEVGVMTPVLPVDTAQQQIYSTRLGKFMQDVNLTPDFPTAAATAQAMWERKNGQRVDGVISVDPVVLSYLLKATGPITLSDPKLSALADMGLPSQLTGNNVVPTLLSDVYAKIEQPSLQDDYFAVVAQQIFEALSEGKSDAAGLLKAVAQGTNEGRVLVWSSSSEEQNILGEYQLSGSIAGTSIPAAQFGVYFNDGTGAKMDYYVKRTVQLVKACPKDGYEQTTVRVTSTNTAPPDAATSLPEYVTGAGIHGVPPGSVQTNVVAYGPSQSNIETVTDTGQQVAFAPYIHSERTVGVYAIRLAPGESKTVEFNFGKIVQHTEPTVVVTPTVQPVKDVILPTLEAVCG